VQNVNQSRVIFGNLLVALDSLEFALKGSLVFKVLPPHDFDGPEHTGDRLGEKDFPVGTSTDSAEDFKVGDRRVV